jgi:multicomponent Na+:H+ antiporter subunit E
VTRRGSTVVLVAWLTVVWVGLWGSVTAANVLGGVAVSVVLVLLLRPSPAGAPAVVSPLALLRFVLRFCADLVLSSVQVVRLALRPRLELRQGIVAVHVPGASDTLLTVLADAISLTPGTLTVDVDASTATLYVHALDVGPGPDGVRQLRDGLHDQARAAVRALGSAEARAQLTSGAAAAGDRRREGRP